MFKKPTLETKLKVEDGSEPSWSSGEVLPVIPGSKSQEIRFTEPKREYLVFEDQEKVKTAVDRLFQKAMSPEGQMSKARLRQRLVEEIDRILQ